MRWKGRKRDAAADVRELAAKMRNAADAAWELADALESAVRDIRTGAASVREMANQVDDALRKVNSGVH